MECPNCKKPLANNMKKCPNCGYDISKYKDLSSITFYNNAKKKNLLADFVLEDDGTHIVKCPNCNNLNTDKDEFCTVCGRQLILPKNNVQNPRSHRRSLLPLLLPIAAVVSVAAVIYVYRSTSSNMPETAPANADAAAELVTAQQTVGEALNEVMSTDEFDKADIDTRKELVGGALNDMQEQGYIQEPVYNAVSELYEYDYTAGGKGGVMIVEFSDDVSGIAKDYADKDSSGKVINVKNKLEYETSKYSYKEKDLSAKVI